MNITNTKYTNCIEYKMHRIDTKCIRTNTKCIEHLTITKCTGQGQGQAHRQGQGKTARVARGEQKWMR